MERAQNSRSSVSQTIRTRIEWSGERLWRFSDFPNAPMAAVAQALSRLARDGTLQRLSKGDFDAVLNAWHTDPSPAAVLQAWGAADAPPNGANFAGYASREFDALVDSASRSSDPARARAYYRRAYGVINGDAPAVWLYEARNVSGIARRVRVTAIRPDAWWSDLADWTIEKR